MREGCECFLEEGLDRGMVVDEVLAQKLVKLIEWSRWMFQCRELGMWDVAVDDDAGAARWRCCRSRSSCHGFGFPWGFELAWSGCCEELFVLSFIRMLLSAWTSLRWCVRGTLANWWKVSLLEWVWCLAM